MPTIRAPFLLLALLAASLVGCDRPGGEAAPDRAAANAATAALAQDVAGINTDVRLAQATKRIDELEREVAHLKSTPATLDLALLEERVQAIEARLATPAGTPSEARPPEQRRPPARPGGLTLPEIEKQR